MARYVSVWLPILSLINGIIAVILSFVAYTKRIKSEDVHNLNGVCSYPDTNAWYYGLWAAINLLVAQITISYAMKCFCCIGIRRYSSKCLAVVSIILFIVSWLSFVITQIGLISTSVTSNHKFLVKHHSDLSNNQESCFVAGENLFLGTAIWCIITIVLGLISYAFWACSIANTNNNFVSSNNDQGVAMGQPHTQLPKEQC